MYLSKYIILSLFFALGHSYLLRNFLYQDEPSFTVDAAESKQISGKETKDIKIAVQDQPDQCFLSHYHRQNAAGKVATCPFNWTTNHDANRIPSDVMEIKCESECRVCGPFHECIQLRARIEVWYKDTRTVMPFDYAIGCVCSLIEIGEKANIYHKSNHVLPQ